MSDVKAEMHRYLRESRECLLSNLDGLGEYDLRRPMTPTGTNRLGLVKHLAGLEYLYLGECFERPAPETDLGRRRHVGDGQRDQRIRHRLEQLATRCRDDDATELRFLGD